MASETSSGTFTTFGLKLKDMEVLSSVFLSSPPEAQAAMLSNVNFDQIACQNGYKNAHAAKVAVGIILKKTKKHKGTSTTPDNGAAITPAAPRKRKTPVKMANASYDDDDDMDTPAKKPRARPKKAASAEPASSKDVEMIDPGEIQTE
ncbi:hypothetical protein MCOR25_005693 [Pyricularia grisea]|nr:hypothetical protein MCOR25_005693 [Pyricularia grisea]